MKYKVKPNEYAQVKVKEEVKKTCGSQISLLWWNV